MDRIQVGAGPGRMRAACKRAAGGVCGAREILAVSASRLGWFCKRLTPVTCVKDVWGTPLHGSSHLHVNL